MPFFPWARVILPLGLAYAGIGHVSAADEAPQFWNVDKLAAMNAERVRLVGRDGQAVSSLTRTRLTELTEVRRRIESVAGMKTDLFIVSGTKPNAFATNVVTGRNLFAINTPMLDEVDGDPDALAALMGHEIAHLERNHIRQRLEAAQNMEAGMNIATIVLAIAGVKGAGAIASLGAGAMMGGYSRDQEREADARGLEFAHKAGFNPYGAVRLFQKIQSKHGDRWVPFLASHPTHDERIAAMNEMAAAAGDSAVLASAVTKLAPQENPAGVAEGDAVGENSATTFDNEVRVPTLHIKVQCTMPSGTVETLTRIECVRREGNFN